MSASNKVVSAIWGKTMNFKVLDITPSIYIQTKLKLVHNTSADPALNH